jgi:transcriptional regulator with XRE-family HTH domain
LDAVELDVESLYVRCDQERRKRHWSWSKVARYLDVAPNTILKLQHSHTPTLSTLLLLLRWLGETDLSPYLRQVEPKPNEP